MSDNIKNNFEKLAAINISKLTVEKPAGGNKPTLTYLSWADAWAQVNKVDPEAAYKVITFDGLPYIGDPDIGYMVFTQVAIFGRILDCHLPVLNSSHKALKKLPYKYTTTYGEKSVNGVNMADINKAIMRCLAKNIALHGLGIHLYTKEDLTDDDATEGAQTTTTAQNNPPDKPSVASSPAPAVVPSRSGEIPDTDMSVDPPICPCCGKRMYVTKEPSKGSNDYHLYCSGTFNKDIAKCKYSCSSNGNARTDVAGKFL